MPSWKKVIISGSNAALNSLTVTNGITGSLYGTSSWAQFAQTASFSSATAETRILVINKSGATISKGMVVHLTGSNNSSDTPYVTTASYQNDSLSANTLGIATQTIAFNDTGYIITEGILTGIDVTGFTSGQLLYLGNAGSIIGTAPVAPLHAVRLGQVVRDSPSNNGTIYVRIDNGYEIGELHDVVDTTTTSSYGDLLVKSGSVWTNSKQLTGSYGLTGSLQATSFTGSFSGSHFGPLTGTASYASQALSASFSSTSSFLNSTTNAFIQNGNSFGTTAVLGTNDNQSLTFETNGSTRMFISSSGDVGVGTTTPGSRFHVFATNSGASAVYNGTLIVEQASGTSIQILSANTQTPSLRFGDPENGLIGRLEYSHVDNSMRMVTNAGEKMRIDSSGNVGIGTTTPNSGSLHVNGNVFATSYTGSLFGTASWANNATTASFVTTAQTASFVTGSNVFGPFGSNSIISASFAVSSSRAVSSSFASTASLVSSIASNITNNTDNYILTATGGSTINGESNLTFDGALLTQAGRFLQGGATSATGQNSHAEGRQTQAVGSESHAEGESTLASGSYSHAEGRLTVAKGSHSHTEGQYTLAQQNGSHAEGYFTTASADYSHAAGLYSVSFGKYQSVIGQYNLSSSADSAFIIGNGTGLDASRSNLVFASGSEFQITGSLNVKGSSIITGSLTVGATSLGASENTVTLGARDTGGEGGQLGFNAPGGTYTSASMLDNYQNRFRLLRGTNAGSDAEIVWWSMHNKQMALPAYNSVSAFPGTATALLAVDTSGNVITVATGSGGGGSGTVTNVATAGSVNGITLTGGPITTTGTITLGGTLSGIANSQLTNSSLMIGNSSISLGATASSLTGLTSVTATSFTGSLQGTSSFAISSSRAVSSSFATNASTASYVLQAVSSSFATSASFAVSSSYAEAARTVGITLQDTTPVTYNITFAGASSGNQSLNVDTTALTYTPSTSTLTVPNLAGTASWANNAVTATSATTATSANTLTNTRTIWGQNFNGSANVTGDLTSVGAITGTSGTDLAISTGGGDRITLNTTTAQAIRFQTNNTLRWVVDGTTGNLLAQAAQTVATSAGNLTLATNAGNANILLTPNGTGSVGIGTTTPSAKLDVNGNTTVTGSLNIVNTFPAIILRNSGSGATGNITIAARDETFTSKTAGTQTFAIAPADSGGTSLGGIVYTKATNNSTNTSFNYNSTGTSAIYISGSGNVGIGTTSPTAKLHVTDANKTFDGYGNVNIFTSDAAAIDKGGSIAFGGVNATGGTSPYVFAKIQGIKEGSTSNYNGALILGTTLNSSAVTEKMRITAAGDVGIGLTSPSQKLDVYGVAVFGTNTNRYTTIGGSSGTMFTQGEVGGWAFGHHAKGSSGTDKGGFGWLGSSDSISYYYIGGAYNNATMYITSGSSGAVGIGTQSPSQTLHVVGSARITGAVYDSSNSAGSSGQVLSSTGTGTSWITSGGGGAAFPYTGSARITGSLGITGSLSTTGSDAFINGVRVGRGAGNIITNTAVGTGSLSSNTTGYSNVAVGANTLTAGTTGAANTAIGEGALKSNTGNGNTAIGRYAGFDNTSGNVNILIGVGLNYKPDATTFNGSYALSIGKNSADIEGYPHIWAPDTVTIGNTANDTILTIDPSSYSGFFLEYVFDDTNGLMRSGTLKGIFTSGMSSIQWAEVDTLSIGNSSGATFSVVDNGSSKVDIKLNNNTGGTLFCNFTSRLILRQL